MAPIKFEDNLKDKLEQRQLQPGEDAWNKLQAQLDAHDTQKNNKGFRWLGIAAGFAGLLLVVAFFFNSGEETNTPQVVDTEQIDTTQADTFVTNNEKTVEEATGDETKEEKKEAVKEKTGEKPALKKQMEQEQKKLIPEKTDQAVADVINDTKAPVDTPQAEKVAENLTFEEQKINEVVAQINALKEKQETVTEEEIDALLDAAQKEISGKKIYNASTKTVDAEALLQDVEDDLERSFRERVFEKLKVGYKNVKTAVAERNN